MTHKIVLFAFIAAFTPLAATAQSNPFNDVFGKNAAITPNGSGFAVQLPETPLALQDGSQFMLPAQKLQLTPLSDQTWQAKFDWPSTATRQTKNGTPLGVVSFGNAPNVSGVWDMAKAGFTKVNINFDGLKFSDHPSASTGKIAQLELNGAPKNGNWQWQGLVNNAQGTLPNGTNGQSKNFSLGQATLQQTWPAVAALSLPQLLQSVQFLLPTNGQPLGQIAATDTQKTNWQSTLNINGFSVSGGKRNVAVGTASLQQTLGADAKNAGKLSTFVDLKADKLKIEPAGIMAPLWPTKLALKGRVTNVDKNIAAQNPPTTKQNLLAWLTKTGGKLEIDNLSGLTQSGAKLSGDGWLKPSETTPAGVVGRLDLRFFDLANAINALKQADAKTAPKPAAIDPNNPAAAMQQMMTQFMGSQAAMGLTLLQNFGKAEEINGQKATRYTIDFTAEGSTLVNGQDISLLLAPIYGVNKLKQKMENMSAPTINDARVPPLSQ
jgi:hypothetical protein